MVDIFTKFPQYCESVVNFWLHEPLNAITNFAFFVGAYFLYKLIKRNEHNMRLGTVLIVLMVILGAGSLAWHSYRSVPTLLMDEIPIYIFIIFAFIFLVQSLTRNYKTTILASLSMASIYYALFAYIPALNIFQGSLKYVFAVIIFLVLNTLITRKFGQECSFVLSLGILVGAIIFRIIDLYICSAFPIGTHFIWHISVATVIYFSSKVILKVSSSQI